MKNSIKYLLLSMSLFLLSFTAASQTVSGTVVDSHSLPVIGATVVVEGTTVGTTTNANGEFSLNMPEGKKVLKVSFIGFNSQTVTVTNHSNIKVVLTDAATDMEEIVVVGYGMVRKSDITGSVTSVKINDKDASRATSFDQLMQGKAAGLQVTSTSFAPGAAVDIKIRGNSSFNTGSEPLYVVDGVILNPPSQSEGTLISSGTQNRGTDSPQNGLMGINPADIASMEILKDASATAIYGSFGANGVVLITTKSGTKERSTITVTSGVDISTRNKKIPMMNLNQYIDYLDAVENTAELKKIFTNIDDRSLGYKDGIEEVNWQDYTLRTAVNQRYRVQFAGKSETLSYMIAAGYTKSQGIVKQTGASQYDARVNLDKTLSKRFKIGARINVAQIKLNMTQGTDAGTNSAASSMMRAMISSRPYYNFKFEEQMLQDPELADEDEVVQSGVPLWLRDFSDESIEYRLTPNFYMEAKIAKWLVYKFSLGGDYRNKDRSKWKGPLVDNDPSTDGVGAVADLRSLRITMDNLLMFNKDFGKHRINGTIGTTFTNSDYRTQSVSSWQIDQYVPQTGNINSGKISDLMFDKSQSATLSYLARAVYSYDDRYVLTATYRIDGSSKFNKSNRYAYFPSLALAWRASEERWMHLPKSMSIKVRLGWGKVGNEGLPAYRTLANYGSNNHPTHNDMGYVVGVHPTNLANTDLKWETTEQYNAGIDFGFLDNKLTLTVDVYDKSTKDLLQYVSTPAAAGFKNMWINRGEIRNRGIEFAVDASIINKENFWWRASANGAMNRNKIVTVGLPPTNADMPPYFDGHDIGSSNYLKTPINIFIEGSPMGLFYGYKTDGLYQQGEQGGTAGSIKYVLNPNNTTGIPTPADRQIIGDPNPDFVYGFNTSLGYKNWSLSLSFNGVQGVDIANVNSLVETDITRPSVNKRVDAVKYAWTPENPNTKYPALTSTYNTQHFTDRMVEDGSYLRLSNVTLSYNIPFKSNKIIRGLEVNFTVGNAYVWTKYSGWDPEVKSYANDMFRMGADNGSYPNARVYSFGISANF